MTLTHSPSDAETLRTVALQVIHATGGDLKRVDEAAHVLAAALRSSTPSPKAAEREAIAPFAPPLRADDGNTYRYHATGLPAGGDYK